MNKRNLVKIFRALSSEENLGLFIQIYNSNEPKLTGNLKSNLSKMPLNRRLNILKEAGLIQRIKTGNKRNELENKIVNDKKLSDKLRQIIESFKEKKE